MLLGNFSGSSGIFKAPGYCSEVIFLSCVIHRIPISSHISLLPPLFVARFEL
jgi:hypothetical protein